MPCGTSSGASGKQEPPAEEAGEEPGGHAGSASERPGRASRRRSWSCRYSPPERGRRQRRRPTPAHPQPRALYVAACESCHGTDGRGNPRIDAPVLAGLSAAYLERQLDGFRRGYRGSRPDDLEGLEMRPMVDGLADRGPRGRSKVAGVTVRATARRRRSDARRRCARGRSGARADALRGLARFATGGPGKATLPSGRLASPGRRAGTPRGSSASSSTASGARIPTTRPAPPCARVWRILAAGDAADVVAWIETLPVN